MYLETDDLTVSVSHGVVTRAEWERGIRQNLKDDPLWPRGRRQLTDLTTFDPAEVTVEDVETVAAIGRDHIARLWGRRQATVATLAWEFARTFERQSALHGSTNVVFNNMPDACTWLGIDPEYVGKVAAQLRAEERGRL